MGSESRFIRHWSGVVLAFSIGNAAFWVKGCGKRLQNCPDWCNSHDTKWNGFTYN